MEWDNNALMAIYRRGLKNSVKNEFIQYKANFKNLKDFICIFIKLDDKIFYRLVKKQGIKPKYKQTGFAYQNYLRGDYNLFQKNPIELDAV